MTKKNEQIELSDNQSNISSINESTANLNNSPIAKLNLVERRSVIILPKKRGSVQATLNLLKPSKTLSLYERNFEEPKRLSTASFENINRKLKKSQKINNSMSDESSEEEEVKLCYIPKDNVYLIIWEVIITFVVLCNSFITPYKVCFDDEEEKISLYQWLTYIALFIDIIINFFTNNKSNYKFKKNVVKYLKSWFIIDLLSAFPIDYFFQNCFEYKANLLSRLPNLLITTKLIQNRNVSNFLSRLFVKLKFSMNLENCIVLMFAFFYFNHLCACLFYFLARLRDLDDSTWIASLGLRDHYKYQIYLWCLYWNLTTVTTVGYGNISAFSWIEKVYTIIIISIGVVMYSFFIGNFSVIISAMNEHENELKEKLQELENINNNYNIKRETYQKVKKVIKYETYKTQIETTQFIQELPNKIKLSLLNIINDKTIQNFYWLKNYNEFFVSSVVPLLHPSLMFQNDCLYQSKEIIDCMYSIGKGSVIYCMSREYNEKEVRFLPRYTNFGEIEMCIGLPIKYSIKMKSKVVELYSLKKIDFVRLTIVFKEFMESFLEKALILYKEFKRNYHKIINEKKEMHNRLLQKIDSNDNSKIKKLIVKSHRKISYSKSVFIRVQDADDEESDDDQLVKAFLQRRASIEFNNTSIGGQIDDLSTSLERNKFKYSSEVYNKVNELFKEVKKESKPKKRLELLEEIEQLLTSNVNEQLKDTNSL